MYIDNPASYTDYYELTMAQGYYLAGMHDKRASFDYFFRKNPFDNGYVVFAGLKELIDTLKHIRFSEEELGYLEDEGFDKDFIGYLKEFKFSGNIWSVKEGEIVFPNEPIVIVEGNLLETQLIETLLLNVLNFQSLIATKAARIKFAAGQDSTILDFGLRRAQGLAGIHATRAAMIGGFDGTSNVYSAQRFSVPAGGTMAHSWIQSFEDELTAFRVYANHYPDNTVLLVDTYDTLGSGVPNAIKVASELRNEGHELRGIRLDSGDLAYFSKQARKMLDDAGFQDVKIAASNQLDERVISSLRSQNAPIDIFGVGTRLVTGDNSPALDGVYKLGSIGGKPTLKISENIEKITLPGHKKIYRYLNDDGSFYGDAILLEKENLLERMHHPTFPAKKSHLNGRKFEELLIPVIKEGEVITELPTVKEISAYRKERFGKLNPEFKRFDNPHIYKVGISTRLMETRDNLLNLLKP
ncbi:nicotinate phosphoribosyltransferase [Rhodohalobacter sp. 614A]|uniref:nicotinate phosphoribosyltransferase n=1 Tax=Rhodohalobacter sp. 614A TaxID=2908649 RepID=UPI001F37BFDC|nr:nicotinate phosphoribosyltransferase [Rhodohalobacter sp. 614A]